jgi:hypothetical protein
VRLVWTFAISMIIPQRKEVRNMKIATSVIAALLFTATLGAINTATGADGILSKDQLTAGSYCHEKFRRSARAPWMIVNQL